MSTEASTEETPGTILVRIENSYSDGHESTVTKRITAPENPDNEDELDEWWNDEVFTLTGDGHGEKNPGLDSSYSAEILDGPAELVGKTYEWG